MITTPNQVYIQNFSQIGEPPCPAWSDIYELSVLELFAISAPKNDNPGRFRAENICFPYMPHFRWVELCRWISSSRLAEIRIRYSGWGTPCAYERTKTHRHSQEVLWQKCLEHLSHSDTLTEFRSNLSSRIHFFKYINVPTSSKKGRGVLNILTKIVGVNVLEKKIMFFSRRKKS